MTADSSSALIGRRLRATHAMAEGAALSQTAPWAALLGAAIVLSIGVPLSAILSATIDESFALHTTHAGPFFAWYQAVTFEQQPPFYFVLESLWRLTDERSLCFARLPSVIFAAVAVGVIVRAANRLAPRIPPAVVAAATALNPFVIWAAVEMRVYALVFLAGAVLMWTFSNGFLSTRRSRRAQIVYVAFAITGLYTQYYIGFLLAAHFFTLLMLRPAAIRSFLKYMAIVALAFGPFISTAITQVQNSGDFISRVTLIRAAYEIGAAVLMFVLPHTLNGAGIVKITGFALCSLLSVVLIWAGKPTIPAVQGRSFIVQWCASIAVFSLVFGILGLPEDPLRHLAVIAPSSMLVALIFLSSLTRVRTILCGAALVSFAILAATQLWSRYQLPLAKPGDYERVARVLSEDTSGAPIAAFPAELAIPLRLYLRTPVTSIPQPMPFTASYVQSTTITAESQVSRALDPLRLSSTRLWLLTPNHCLSATLMLYKNSCSFVETYMARRYRVARSLTFRGTLARFYVALPKLSFRSHSHERLH